MTEDYMGKELAFNRKLKRAAAVSLVTVLVGLFLNGPYLWFAIAVLIAAISSLIVNSKVTCDDLGRAQTTSAFLNVLLSVTMYFATFGWIVCVGLLIWWIV